MPGIAPFKAQALMRDLKQRLELSIPSVSFEENLDSSYYPILKVSSASESIFIKIEPVATDRIDAIGLPQTVYAPHKTIILEKEDGAGIDSALRIQVLSQCVRSFTEVLVYQIAAANFPSQYDLTGASLIATVKADVIHGINAQQ